MQKYPVDSNNITTSFLMPGNSNGAGWSGICTRRWTHSSRERLVLLATERSFLLKKYFKIPGTRKSAVGLLLFLLEVNSRTFSEQDAPSPRLDHLIKREVQFKVTYANEKETNIPLNAHEVKRELIRKNKKKNQQKFQALQLRVHFLI